MSTMTLEQVRDKLRNDGSPGWSIPNAAACEQLANAIDALLREREAAKAGVTDEMVHVVASAMAKLDGADPDHLIWEGSPPEPWGEVWCRYEDSARTVLEAFAPMLASARVPDEIRENDPRMFNGWSSPDVAYRAGWNQCRAAMLAAAPKPETEE